MNERIRGFAEQAGLEYNFDPMLWLTYEKFAVLIIRECAQVSEDDVTDGDACCTNTADRIARQIKKHFGIKECY